MPVVKFRAAEIKININTGDDTTPVWTPIKGISSLEIDPEKNTQSTRDFYSGKWAEHMVISRGATFTTEGFRLEDTTTGERDPGQEAVEALQWEVGADAEGHFQIISSSGATKEFRATVTVTPFGGGEDELSQWSAEFEVTGAIAESPATP